MEDLKRLIQQEWHKIEIDPPDAEVVRDLALKLSGHDIWIRGTSPEGLSVRTDNLVPSHYDEMFAVLEAARTSTQGVLFQNEVDRR